MTLPRKPVISLVDETWVPPKSFGGDPPQSDGGDMKQISERLAKLEGQIGVQQWAVAIVSAMMISALAIIMSMQLQLSSKVDVLPGQISGDIQQIVTTLSTAITAKNSEQQPTIIVVPNGVQPVVPTTNPETQKEAHNP